MGQRHKTEDGVLAIISLMILEPWTSNKLQSVVRDQFRDYALWCDFGGEMRVFRVIWNYYQLVRLLYSRVKWANEWGFDLKVNRLSKTVKMYYALPSTLSVLKRWSVSSDRLTRISPCCHRFAKWPQSTANHWQSTKLNQQEWLPCAVRLMYSNSDLCRRTWLLQ